MKLLKALLACSLFVLTLSCSDKNATSTNDTSSANEEAVVVESEGLSLNSFPELSGPALFEKIKADNQGKVVLIDVWATWCGPCIMQMGYSKKLHKKLDGQNVSFYYLCIQSEENKWREVVAKRKPAGENIFLSEDQQNFFGETFNIRSIPRYILLDKQGNVANDNAPFPSDTGLKMEIDKLLAGE